MEALRRQLNQNFMGIAAASIIVFILVAYSMFWVSSKRLAMARSKRAIPPICRGSIYGTAAERPGETEADHFVQCPGCGAWVDMRDLGIVLDDARPCRNPQFGTSRSSLRACQRLPGEERRLHQRIAP